MSLSLDRAGYSLHFQIWVRERLAEFHAGIVPWYQDRGRLDGDSLSYFLAHMERFWAMIELATECGAAPKSAAEVGSFYPYTTKFFDCPVDLYDLMPLVCAGAREYDVDGIRLLGRDVCTQPLDGPGQPYDLVICSEVMEHLPCDLFAFQDKVSDVLAPGGLLIASYPMHGYGADRGYELDLGPSDRLYHEHLREFTDDTVPLFFKGLRHEQERDINYPAYGRIKAVAYRKEP